MNRIPETYQEMTGVNMSEMNVRVLGMQHIGRDQYHFVFKFNGKFNSSMVPNKNLAVAHREDNTSWFWDLFGTWSVQVQECHGAANSDISSEAARLEWAWGLNSKHG